MKRQALLCLLTTLLTARTLVAAQAPPAPPTEGRVFELRTYTASPGKLDALNARFRKHTLALFGKHGMEIVGFLMPVDKEAGAGEKLAYILAHQSRAAAAAWWQAFRVDPDWVKVKTNSEANAPSPPRSRACFSRGRTTRPSSSRRGSPGRYFPAIDRRSTTNRIVLLGGMGPLPEAP